MEFRPSIMPFSVPQYISVVIIGGGQAGLSASYCLRQRGVDDHVIFEKGQVGQSWREACADGGRLATPNRECLLPGNPYDGDDPVGFMTKAQVTAYIDRYMKKIRPPILEGAEVTLVGKEEGYFRVTSGKGLWYCDDVIVAIGGGAQPDFKFIELPVFNMRGFPEAERGVTSIPGLYFLGLPWMSSSDSAEGPGIAEDADHIAAQIAIGVENDLNVPETQPSLSNSEPAIS